MYLENEMKSENMSDTHREMARRRKSTEQASNVSANVHGTCVSGTGLVGLASRSRFPARRTQLKKFPARFVLIINPKLFADAQI